jgi:hypothetical protein
VEHSITKSSLRLEFAKREAGIARTQEYRVNHVVMLAL